MPKELRTSWYVLICGKYLGVVPCSVDLSGAHLNVMGALSDNYRLKSLLSEENMWPMVLSFFTEKFAKKQFIFGLQIYQRR